MIQRPVFEYPGSADYRTGPRFPCTKNQGVDTGVDQRTGTHGAGFQGDIESAPRQAIVSLPPGCLPQRENLRMSRGVAPVDGGIASPTDESVFKHHQGSDRNFSGIRRFLSQFQCLGHPVLVLCGGVFGSRCPGTGFRTRCHPSVTPVRWKMDRDAPVLGWAFRG